MRFWLAVMVLVGCATTTRPPCPTHQPSSLHRPFLWEVSGPSGSIILQATHSAAGSDDVSPEAWAALETAELYVAEADEVPDDAQYGADKDWNAAFHLPRGMSLQKLLPADEYFDLRDQLPEHDVNGLKPWVAFVLLGAKSYRFPEPNINAALLDRVRKRGISTDFLETWQSQVAFLDASIDPPKLVAAIRDMHNMSCRMNIRLAAFRAGDDAVFANEIVHKSEPVVARITRWHVRLDDYLRSGRRTFVALGIGQIVGPYGLLSKLSALGYRVRRL